MPGTKFPGKGWADEDAKDRKPKGSPYSQRLDGVTVVDLEARRYSHTDSVPWDAYTAQLIEACSYVVQTREDGSGYHLYYAGEHTTTQTKAVKASGAGVDCIKSGPGQQVVGAGSTVQENGSEPKHYKLLKNAGALTTLPADFKALVQPERQGARDKAVARWQLPDQIASGAWQTDVARLAMSLQDAPEHVVQFAAEDFAQRCAAIRKGTHEQEVEQVLRALRRMPEWHDASGGFVDLSVKPAPVKSLLTVRDPKQPKRRTGIVPLGQWSVVVGDAGTGKTFFCIWLASRVAKKHGMNVLWMDAEIGYVMWHSKVWAVQGARNALNKHVVFQTALPDDLSQFGADWLVLYDSITRWGCPQDGSNPTDWINKHIGPFLARGCTVLGIDHRSYTVTRDSKPLVGAGAKVQAVQGSILRLDAVRPFAPGQSGLLALTVDKDNSGATCAAIGQRAAYVHVDADCAWRMSAAGTEPEGGKPAALEQAFKHLQRAIETNTKGFITNKEAIECLQGIKQARTERLGQLVAAGRIRRTPKGRASHYTLGSTV